MRWRSYQHKRWIIAAVFICIVIIAGVWWNERRGDPVVEGKRLSEWLDEIDFEASSATKAIGIAGADAVPYLLRRVSDDECSFGFKAKVRIYQLLGRDMTGLGLEFSRVQAAIGFQVLGTNGQSAGKELVRLVDHQCTRELALMSLAFIKSPEGLRKFASLMEETDPQRRLLGLNGLRMYQETNEAMCEKVLRLARTDSDIEVRTNAIVVLATVGEGNRIVVPALLELYGKEKDERVRGACLEALGGFWQQAELFEQTLISAAQEPSPVLRNGAEQGLNSLWRARKTSKQTRP